MKTEVLTLDGTPRDLERLAHAAATLRAGELVAFPTETVYGLGADAHNPAALAKLARVKERPEGKPFSLLVPSAASAEEESGDLSRVARKLMRIYWPGPLTVVVPHKTEGNVGLRLSEHPVTRAMLSEFGGPVAAPSANLSGRPDPTNLEMVLKDLDGKIPLVLDGGPSWQGRSSAVVRLDGPGKPQIQRSGAISDDDIMRVARPTILFVCTGNTCRSPIAEGYGRDALGDRLDAHGLTYRVTSAGTSAVEGHGADSMAVRVMREMEIDLSLHRTRQLAPALLDEADWIFTMTQTHLRSILKVMPECETRTRLLSAEGVDIPDPAGHNIERYRTVREQIAGCLKEVLQTVGRAAS